MNRYIVRKSVGRANALPPIVTRGFPSFALAVADAVDFVTTAPDAWQATVVDADSVIVADLKRVRG